MCQDGILKKTDYVVWHICKKINITSDTEIFCLVNELQYFCLEWHYQQINVTVGLDMHFRENNQH